MIMKIKEEDKDLNYWKKNCENDYLHTPISVLRYITELEKAVNNGVLDDVSKPVICQDWIHQDMLRMNYKFCSICGTKLESK